MVKKGQVYIRAKNKEGRWSAVDVLDLDDASYRAFVLDKLVQMGALCSMADEYCVGDPIEYQERKTLKGVDNG